MFKVLGHPLRIQITKIIISERLASIPVLQHHLPDVDPFRLYSNLRSMHRGQVIRKLRKGREIYYGLSEQAIATRLDTLFAD